MFVSLLKENIERQGKERTGKNVSTTGTHRTESRKLQVGSCKSKNKTTTNQQNKFNQQQQQQQQTNNNKTTKQFNSYAEKLNHNS